jgi:Ino eighty subunit 2
MIRWVSSISGHNVSLRVGVPVGKEEWIAVGGQSKEGKGVKRDTSGVCAVEGCGERRKYRSIGRFEVGGCCLQHLKAVEAGLRG